MPDSKLAWHFQRIVDADLVNSEWVKIVDPPEQNPFPGKRVIGRMFMPDAESNALIWQGADGARQWFDFWVPEFEKRSYIHAWEGPNEPQPMANATFRTRLDEFTHYLAHRMRHDGKTLVGHNWSVGWTDKGHAPGFGKSISALAEHGHYLGLHEYSAPWMWAGDGWYTLRYRRTFAELRAAGIPIPDTLIVECGIDGGVIYLPKTGWKTYATPTDYMQQLGWYNSELCKDPEIKAAFVFTAGPHPDWYDFDVTREMSEKINRYNATYTCLDVPAVVPPAIPQPPEWTDLVGQLAEHETERYKTRKLEKITRTVIHHSGANANVAKPGRYTRAIARYHVRLGWPGIGYHYTIGQDGRIFRTQPLRTVSYHAGGGYNATSVGVCLLGNFKAQDPTDAQLLSARALCDWIGNKTVPHKALAPTSCPGRWARWGDRITG